MENFIVSARKYRPQTFDTVVGQKSITNTLKNAIRNHQVAQAFLFCGPRGVGKTTCARILAKTINCSNLSPNMEACDQCTSCVSFNESASFNIYELDGASNNSVDDIRTLVDQVRIPPQSGAYKVYIIDEVHMLSASAFNAFLKTLEEPPPYAKFILATTEKHKILPTILSRCQIFDFRRITVEDIASHLMHVAEQEGVRAEDNALHIIAQKADGAMRDALSIFDQLVSFAGNELTYNTVTENLNVLDYEYYFRITDFILQGDIPGALLTIDEILGKGFDGQHFLIGFGEHLRNLLVCKDAATAKLLETAPSIRGRYVEQAAICPVAALLQMLDLTNRCDLSYKVSNNKRLHLELAVMQMCAPVARNAATPVIPSPAAGAPATPAAPVRTAAPAPPPAPVVPQPTSPAPQAQPQAPAPEPRVAPAGTMRMRDLPSGFSGSTSMKPAVQGTAQGPQTAEDADQPRPESPFSPDELDVHWSEFAESLRNDSPHLYSTLKAARPEILPGWTLQLPVDNKVLDDELSTRKTDLLEFLRSRLNNYRISLQTKITESQATTRPYTDKEKFERMIEKNPEVGRLREELDLEIEY